MEGAFPGADRRFTSADDVCMLSAPSAVDPFGEQTPPSVRPAGVQMPPPSHAAASAFASNFLSQSATDIDDSTTITNRNILRTDEWTDERMNE